MVYNYTTHIFVFCTTLTNNKLMRTGRNLQIALILFFVSPVAAQRPLLNMADHDDKPYYFGITFGLNYSVYQISYTESFANTDTFKKIQPHWQPGFNLGLIGNLKINRFFDLRFVPSLVFSEKNLVYEYGIPADSTVSKNIESIYMHLPVQLKIKSDRIGNFRFYALVGGKFDYDMAANARSRRPDEFLKVSPTDFGAEVGVGFEFYNPDFIFSPEIKLSQGLTNQLYPDHGLQLTNAIQSLLTRMIVISIHLEG